MRHASLILDLVKTLLPTSVGAILGWLLLRRLEGIKSEVAQHSDFKRKWADLFFEACHKFMVSAERLRALAVMLSVRSNNSDELGMKWQGELNELLVVLVEHDFRLQRLAMLSPLQGPLVVSVADRIVENLQKFTKSRVLDAGELGKLVGEFNKAAKKAHSEMLSAQSVGPSTI